MEVIKFNKHLIAAKVSDSVCDWCFIGFNGPPYVGKKKKKKKEKKEKKRKARENLNGLLETIHGPWICMGDFNLTNSDDEKWGGTREGSSTPNFLKDIMFELGIVDLGFSGKNFTWFRQ